MIAGNKMIEMAYQFHGKWMEQPNPPAGLLEERILEMEQLGLLDQEDDPGMPSDVRQFALASLLHKKPPYFVTINDDLLLFRDVLEERYGMMIFSIPEALLLLKEIEGPPN